MITTHCSSSIDREGAQPQPRGRASSKVQHPHSEKNKIPYFRWFQSAAAGRYHNDSVVITCPKLNLASFKGAIQAQRLLTLSRQTDNQPTLDFTVRSANLIGFCVVIPFQPRIDVATTDG